MWGHSPSHFPSPFPLVYKEIRQRVKDEEHDEPLCLVQLFPMTNLGPLPKDNPIVIPKMTLSTSSHLHNYLMKIPLHFINDRYR